MPRNHLKLKKKLISLLRSETLLINLKTAMVKTAKLIKITQLKKSKINPLIIIKKTSLITYKSLIINLITTKSFSSSLKSI
jgi:hypothetical protein